MPIDSVCSGCGRTLRVADEYAGAEAQCPMCNTVYRVPTPRVTSPAHASSGLGSPSSGSPSSGSLTSGDAVPVFSAAAPPIAAPAANVPGQFWIRIPSGAEFGPVPYTTLQQWESEGRVNATCFIRNELDPRWQPFATWKATVRPAAAMHPAYAFGEVPSAAGGAVRYPRSSHGPITLGLGILTWFLCITWIGGIPVAIAALILGYNDLKSIARGETSPKERTITLIGMWLAGSALVINILMLGLIILGAIVSP